ncbi:MULTISPECIES: TRAP transporter large permease subunit [Halocynthiibacter]|uniref:TRAP transporter large permease subunit n=1 Tax=Halocynthiibacter halioticoli TaxID=2986804 RepID=A0AAE3IYY0_9RHOB|nr:MULTISPECIES: TRAP transporter large permease subunit [Halocynthiibacter]MCV6824559.1 TRAP transporter large permease subunit [Halocynthiibacter halioticoli]MCW4057560.1 TRAP transporter large permease subunit [Halocynthiibacter sp. SDUM655004]
MENPAQSLAGGNTTPAIIKVGRAVEGAIALFLAILLALMVVAISWQVASRYLLNIPSMYSEEFLRFSLIWLGMIAAGYCFVGGRHMSLPLLIDVLPPVPQKILRFINSELSMIFGAILIWGGSTSFVANSKMLTPMTQIPVGWLQSVLIICGAMILIAETIRVLCQLGIVPRDPQAPAPTEGATFGQLAIATLIVAIFGACIVTLWQSDWMSEHVYSSLELTSTIVLFTTFVVFLIIGAPIAIGLAFAGVLTLGLQIDLDVMMPTVGETMFNGLDSFGFLALPFFILAGNIMNATGLARRLIDFAMLLGGRIPGSLWQTNVLANMLFGTLSGSGIASATAIGGIINPVAREKGYNMAMTTAVNAASAPSGMLIPPSGALIVYSLITGGGASIIALFMAGYLPGIIMGLSVMLVAYWYAKKHGYEAESDKPSRAETMRLFMRAAPSLMLVVIVISGILGGAFTAIEGSGIAVVYSLMLALVYRGLNLRKLFEILRDTSIVTGAILFLIAASTMMSWSMTFASIPETVRVLMTSVSDNFIVILLMINLILLVVGVFMDMSPAMLIFTPIFYPIVTELGVDPVHFGVILIYNLALGLVTPPVGTVLFVSCSISGEPISKVIGPLLPIFALQAAGLLLITFVPAISLALPTLFGL